MKKLITAILLAMLLIAPVSAKLETAVEGAEVTVADIEWTFVPSGDGAYHVKSVGSGKYLGKSGDAIAMVDSPVGWIYEIRGEDGLDDYALYSPELDAPLRFSPNMSRYSLRTPFTYIGLFEKTEAEGGGGTRYVKVTEVKDNAVYIVMGMTSDDGVPKALTNFLETQDGNNMGGAAVDIVNGEYITFDAPAPEPETEPEPEPQPTEAPAVEPEQGGENETEAAAAPATTAEETKEDGGTNTVVIIIAAAAVVVIAVIAVLAVKKKKK